MNIMGNSIQDYLKKINSRLTWVDCLSLLVTSLFLLGFLGYLYRDKGNNDNAVEYRVFNSAVRSNGNEQIFQDIRPFGSKFGKTYTFSWCQGSSMIDEKNKQYFASEEEAKRTGRKLSKLCEK